MADGANKKRAGETRALAKLIKDLFRVVKVGFGSQYCRSSRVAWKFDDGENTNRVDRERARAPQSDEGGNVKYPLKFSRIN